jgi:hypothetical protein
MKSEQPYNELGRRLLGAVLSYQAGSASVDRVLKRYVPEIVAPCWAELGQRLLSILAGQSDTPALLTLHRRRCPKRARAAPPLKR